MKKLTKEQLVKKMTDNLTALKISKYDIAEKLDMSLMHVHNSTNTNTSVKNKTLIAVAKEVGLNLEIRENVNGKFFYV
jgi:DNA-binding TFAR19-related protein (PDSD5 family)